MSTETRQHDLIERIAAQLGLRVVQRLRGGNFGALLVESPDATHCVLKALPSTRFEADWRRGSVLCNRMQASGYPAPSYIGVGTHTDCTWSLQTFVDGALPSTSTVTIVAQMAALARRHIDQADRHGDFLEARAAELDWARAALADSVDGRELLRRALPVLEQPARRDLRRTDVVHGDFHPANVLVRDDDIVCVFDWEGAAVGDWRFDLANVLVVTNNDALRAELHAHAPYRLAGVFVTYHLLRYLAFDALHRPQEFRDRLQHVQSNFADFLTV